ncbi:MAG TPA: patatin-like phospholipase family protein [Candidatus Angelobacter sp.]|nr:patatin-like phospholipase family protein [Candidatus Angelobacter sp.]
MDPMLELAREFLKTERPDGETQGKFPQDVYTQIDEAVSDLLPGFRRRREKMPVRRLQQILWESRDERAQEILANVFYANPAIARRLCEILGPDHYPKFISYLLHEARNQWERDHAGGDLRNNAEDLRSLFQRYGYPIHETFPTKLALSLLEHPDFMVELADHLRVALPFSLVLNKELEEITKSREERLRPDPDAKAAKRMKNILRLNTSLDRLGTEGNDNNVKIRAEKLLREEQERMWNESRDGNGPTKTTWHARAKAKAEQLWKRVFGNGLKPIKPAATYPLIRAEETSLFGLALSGGGIRSATFNLGILQGLADLDLMRRIDYLSGVSGGSHIAAWLAAWIKRETDGIRRVQRWLSPLRSPTPDTDETHPIQFLRRFSNYLAPRKGFFSADMWSIFAIWLRNTILNQLVFVMLIASLLCVPKLVLELFSQRSWFHAQEGWVGSLTLTFTLLLAAWIGANLRDFDSQDQRGRTDKKSQSAHIQSDNSQASKRFGIIAVAGFGLLGFAGTALLFWSAYDNGELGWGPCLVILSALLIGQACSQAWRNFISSQNRGLLLGRQKLKALLSILLVSSVSSLAGWGTLYLGFNRYQQWQEATEERFNEQLAAAVVFGPACLMGVLSVIIMAYIGLMGRNLPDTRREWWSRLNSHLLIALTVWTAVSACALYGPLFPLWLSDKWKGLGLIGSLIPWLTTGWLGSRWGFASQTPSIAGDRERKKTKSIQSVLQTAPLEWVARVAPYIYIGGLAIVLSYLLFWLNFWICTWQHPGDCQWENISISSYWTYTDALIGYWWLLPSLLAMALTLAWRFGVNEFSMHHLYFNRLVRCYLGASRKRGDRKPNPFTGFDPDDDLSISVFRVNPPDPADLTRAARPYYGPLLIFNTALNLVAGKELAWQERKAASFVFTPLYCGYELAHGTESAVGGLANFGYRPTDHYAEPESLGPSMGTSMTISGAAVNPNMGYHSSPALSFLMTLFNFRLGCWMGNPRHSKTWKKSSPTAGLGYLLNELMGNTDDDSRFINLSDGGHFDNLGLYELVRRRCKYIIVCDAEEDYRFSFQGLGGAIRKCRADFGIDIRLNPDRLRPVPDLGKEGRSIAHCAVGEIVYSPETRGKLLYIKASLTGDEPGDVLEYRLRHQVFPHQSTVDQFFDESQFESYRALGQHIAMVILKRAADYSENDSIKAADEKSYAPRAVDNLYVANNERFLESMFRYLQSMWYPPTQNMRDKGEEHSKQYAELVEKFTSHQTGFAAAARTFFRTSGRPRPQFFVYSTMIELMHRVFQDMDLETTADHPHNEGWMNIFRGWANDKKFQNVWEVTRNNYDIRFRNFCEKELGLSAEKARAA